MKSRFSSWSIQLGGGFALFFVACQTPVEPVAPEDPRLNVLLEKDLVPLGEPAVLLANFVNVWAPEEVWLPTVNGIRYERIPGTRLTSGSFNESVGLNSFTNTIRVRLHPEKQGVFRIPSLTAKVDGETVYGQPLTLTVQGVAKPKPRAKPKPLFDSVAKVSSDRKFEVTLDNHWITLGESVVMRLNFHNFQPVLTNLTLPFVKSLKFTQDSMAASQVSIIAGVRSEMLSLPITVRPETVGVFKIPAMTVQSGYNTYLTGNPVTLVVEKSETKDQ